MNTGAAGGDSPSAKYGVVIERGDGHDCVLFERQLQHCVEEVWAAIVEPRQRAVWVPGIRFEPEPEGRFDIWFGEECEGPAHVSGTLTSFEPPRRVQLGTIGFELEPGERGGCLLRFSDVLWYDDKRTKTEFANAVLGGWHRFLDQLEVWLDEGRRAEYLPEPDYSKIDMLGRK